MPRTAKVFLERTYPVNCGAQNEITGQWFQVTYCGPPTHGFRISSPFLGPKGVKYLWVFCGATNDD